MAGSSERAAGEPRRERRPSLVVARRPHMTETGARPSVTLAPDTAAVEAAREAAAARAAAAEVTEPRPGTAVEVRDIPDEEFEDLPDLEDEQDPDSGFLHSVGKAAGAVAGVGAVSGITGIARFGAVKSLTLVDRLALKLNSWGDGLLKKADMPFPFGTLASVTAGGLDWVVGALASEKSLAELIKKEKEEQKKAEDKALAKLLDDQKKMEKKQDDAAKKKKEKEQKKKKLQKAFGRDQADAIEEAIEAEEKEEEPKAEEKEAA